MIHSKSFSSAAEPSTSGAKRGKSVSSPPTSERAKTLAIHSKVDFFQPESLLAPKYAEAAAPQLLF
jgi:hypothetical protein